MSPFTPSGCIFISLLEFPPSLDLSWTRTVFAPLRAAASAAQIPARPPPATITSHSSSSLDMFGSAEKSNFFPLVLASISRPRGLFAALSARASGTLTDRV